MNNIISKFGKLFIILFFIALVLLQAGKKFTLDELDFPIVAEATSQSGVPIYYRGEGSEDHIGIYHPPLYIYALAGFIKVFSYSEYTVRIFGLICTLLTSFVAIRSFRLLFGNSDRTEIKELIFLAIFLLHPYTIANTTLPDIDQTVLPLFMAGYIYLLIKFCTCAVVQQTNYLKNLILIGLYFSLVLWCKLTTPLSLIPLTLFLFYISRFNFARSIYFTVVIVLSGVILFISSYYLYCLYFNLPFEYTFGFLMHSFSKGTAATIGAVDLIDKIFNNFVYGLQFIYWLTPEFVLLTLASLVFLLISGLKDKGRRILLLLLFYSIGVTFLYLGLISPFGRFFKYPYPVIWIFCFSIANFIVDECYLDFINANKKYLILLISIFTPLIFLVFLNFGDNLILSNSGISIYYFITIIFTSVFIGYKYKNFFIKCITFFIFLLMVSSELSISISQALSKYPTKYEYGQLGFNETVAYLKDNTYKNEVIWSMKDVGYYVNNRYIENYPDVFNPNIKNRLIDLIKNKNIRYFVVTKDIGEDRIDAYPELKLGLDNCCVVVNQFGNFVIYKARGHE